MHKNLRRMSALEMASTVLLTTINLLRALSLARILFWRILDNTAYIKNLLMMAMSHYGGTTLKMYIKNALNTSLRNALKMPTKRLRRTMLLL